MRWGPRAGTLLTMPATDTTTKTVPTGTWRSDAALSGLTFSLPHLGIQTLRGRLDRLDACLEATDGGEAVLSATVDASAISAKDPRISALLRSPELFDTSRYPELRFASTAIRRAGDSLELDGLLTIKSHSLRIAATGTIVDEDPYDAGRIWLELTTTVDRRQFGLTWNTTLPGGGLALGHEVTVHLLLALTRVEAPAPSARGHR